MVKNAYFTLSNYSGSIDSIRDFTSSALNKGVDKDGIAIPSGGVLQFPPGLGGSSGSATIPFTLFMPYKRRTGFDSIYSALGGDSLYSSLPTPDFAIALPTPTSALKTTYGVEYETFEVGQAAGIVASNRGESATVGAGAILGGLLGGGKGALFGAIAAGTLTAAGGGNLLKAAGFTAAQTAIGALAKVGGGDSEGVGAIALGLQDNPFTENVFKNVNFREHTFTYTFMPKNIGESETIDQIISVFKYTMLPMPAVGGAFFEFPYEFQIVHSIQNTTFTLLPSVLTSFAVDYGGGTDSLKLFVSQNGKQFPAKITVDMAFKEMVLLNRNRVKNDFDLKDESAPTTNNTLRFRF